eukprot:12896330-Prorocentrum_lima.AAC.1
MGIWSLRHQPCPGIPVSTTHTSTTMAIKSMTSHVAFNWVVLAAPKVTASSRDGSGSGVCSNFLGGALTLVSCDGAPCHEEVSNPGPRV